MKVKDLLNKIANSEEVPKKIKYNEYIYSYVDRNKLFAKYIREPFNAKIPYYLFTDIISIDDEIEIIEEEKDKEIERLNNIINKAIEYIEQPDNIQSVAFCKEDEEIMNLYKIDGAKSLELLDILKGSDKDE